MGSTCGIICITKAVSWWQVSRTSVQLGEPNGNDGSWTMTGTKCAAIKRLISIMRSGNKTEIINRRKTLDLINWNGRIFSRRDQIQMPTDEVPTEEVASQQQTLAVVEGPLQDSIVTCKQCAVNFVFTKGEQRFFQGEKWRNQHDARNAGNGFVKSERKQPAKIDSRIVPLGLNSKLQ